MHALHNPIHLPFTPFTIQRGGDPWGGPREPWRGGDDDRPPPRDHRGAYPPSRYGPRGPWDSRGGSPGAGDLEAGELPVGPPPPQREPERGPGPFGGPGPRRGGGWDDPRGGGPERMPRAFSTPHGGGRLVCCVVHMLHMMMPSIYTTKPQSHAECVPSTFALSPQHVALPFHVSRCGK